jgi:hypothetical protein
VTAHRCARATSPTHAATPSTVWCHPKWRPQAESRCLDLPRPRQDLSGGCGSLRNLRGATMIFMRSANDGGTTRIAFALRVGTTALVGIAATMVAVSAACHVANVRGPQFDVVLGPIDPAIEGAEVFAVGTLSGAIALVCGLRIWREIRSDSASRGASLRDSDV